MLTLVRDPAHTIELGEDTLVYVGLSDATFTLPLASGTGRKHTVKNASKKVVLVDAGANGLMDGFRTLKVFPGNAFTLLDYDANLWGIL